MGSHKKSTRIRTSRRLPGVKTALAAAPAVAGMAAAFCLSPQALASPATGHTVRTAIAAGAHQTAPRLAELRSVARPAAAHRQQGLPTWYTVKSGDSLSAIAGRFYGNAAAWPVLYWANKSQLQSANLILPGQQLRVPVKPAYIPAAPAAAAPAPQVAYTPQVSHAAYTPQVAYTPPVSHVAYTPPVSHAAYTPSRSAYSATYSGSGGSSFQRCVIARESGGNAQIMNSTGHYGLYQFSASTWAAYGGNPADFGRASVGEQNQVFNNAIAAGGQSNWAPYDGC